MDIERPIAVEIVGGGAKRPFERRGDLRSFERRNGQRGHGLDLFHGETRRDIFQSHRTDELPVENIVAPHVRDDDTQHIVDVAGHAVELHDFRHGANNLGKSPQPRVRMVVAFDGYEYGQSKANLVVC